MRDKIKIPPVPKIMNPIFHEGKRKARAEPLQAKCVNKWVNKTSYTDAAKHEGRVAHLAVVVACCTIGAVMTVEAEEVAIALASS